MNWAEIISLFGTLAVVIAASHISSNQAALRTDVDWIKNELKNIKDKL